MEKILTKKERDRLIALHKIEQNRRSCDRIKAVLAYDDGYSYAEIAKILLLDDETARRFVNDYLTKNKLRLQNKGSESHLDSNQTEKLLLHLEEKVYVHVKDICAYVKKTFDVIYTVSGMCKWLYHHEFRYKQPHLVPAKADQSRQEAFIETYKELKATKNPDEIILFCDSAHPQHQTKVRCGWIKKGVRKCVKMTARQKRVNIIGAIELDTHHVEYAEVEWINVESLKKFSDQLCAAYSNVSKIHLILDNAGYHKNKEWLAYIDTTKIKLHYLPPYSPNLNPIERLWKIMHEKVTYNQYYEKFSYFKNNILNFFANIGDYIPILRNRINDNFQKLEIA